MLILSLPVANHGTGRKSMDNGASSEAELMRINHVANFHVPVFGSESCCSTIVYKSVYDLPFTLEE